MNAFTSSYFSMRQHLKIYSEKKSDYILSFFKVILRHWTQSQFRRLLLFLLVAPLESLQCLLLVSCPKILAGDRDLQVVLCHSMNAGCVAGTIRGDRDTQTISAVIKFI